MRRLRAPRLAVLVTSGRFEAVVLGPGTELHRRGYRFGRGPLAAYRRIETGLLRLPLHAACGAPLSPREARSGLGRFELLVVRWAGLRALPWRSDEEAALGASRAEALGGALADAGRSPGAPARWRGVPTWRARLCRGCEAVLFGRACGHADCARAPVLAAACAASGRGVGEEPAPFVEGAGGQLALALPWSRGR